MAAGRITPTLEDGWLIVPCDAPSSERVAISVGGEFNWQPAFRDTVNGQRVAKVRPPSVTPGSIVEVRLRVGTVVSGPVSIRT